MKIDPQTLRKIKVDHEKYVVKGMELIHAEATRDSILEMLKSGDPVGALVKTLVMILHKVDEAARVAGIEVEDAAKLLGAGELLNQLYEIGKAAKIMKLEPDELHLALAGGIQSYVKDEIAANRIDPKKLAATMKTNLSQLPEKDKAESLLVLKKIEQTGKKYAAKIGGR